MVEQYQTNTKLHCLRFLSFLSFCRVAVHGRGRAGIHLSPFSKLKLTLQCNDCLRQLKEALPCQWLTATHPMAHVTPHLKAHLISCPSSNSSQPDPTIPSLVATSDKRFVSRGTSSPSHPTFPHVQGGALPLLSSASAASAA